MSAVHLTNKPEHIHAADDAGMQYFLDGPPIAYKHSLYMYIPVIDGGVDRGMKRIAKVPSPSLSLLNTDYISEQETLVTTIIGTFTVNETNRFLLDNLVREAHTMRTLLPAAHLKMQGAANILYWNTFIANFDNKTPMSIFDRFTDFIENVDYAQSQKQHGGWLDVAKQLFLAMQYIHSQGFAYKNFIGPYDVVYTDDDSTYQGRKYMLMNFVNADRTTDKADQNTDLRYLAKFVVSQADKARPGVYVNITPEQAKRFYKTNMVFKNTLIPRQEIIAYHACRILAADNTTEQMEIDISYAIIADILGISGSSMLQTAIQTAFTDVAMHSGLYAFITASTIFINKNAIMHFIQTLTGTTTWLEKAGEGTLQTSRGKAIYTGAQRLWAALSRSPSFYLLCAFYLKPAYDTYNHYNDPYLKYRNTLQTLPASWPETEEYV